MEALETVARALVQARAHQRTVAAAALEGALATPDDAYWVQELVSREGGWAEDGVARHWKSGGPARTGALTHAPLPPGGIWRSPADARGFHFNVRLIEAEVALRLARDVTPDAAEALSPEEAAGLVESMAVSIEIVDSRWAEGPKAAPALLKLADLQSHGALVLGDWVPFQPRRDWAAQRLQVDIGNQPPAVFTGTHALGDPAWVLPGWLRHATRDGGTVRAGAVVTTGTWCGVLFAHAGDRVAVTFDGVGQASVQL